MNRKRLAVWTGSVIAAAASICTIADFIEKHHKQAPSSPPTLTTSSPAAQVPTPIASQSTPTRPPRKTKHHATGPSVQTNSTTQISIGHDNPNINGVGGNVTTTYGGTSGTPPPPQTGGTPQ
jgi:hypothetical protein